MLGNVIRIQSVDWYGESDSGDLQLKLELDERKVDEDTRSGMRGSFSLWPKRQPLLKNSLSVKVLFQGKLRQMSSVQAPSERDTMLTKRTSPYWLILSLLLTGCLPSSCTRVESRSVSAADSLSRAIAAAMPVDTLVIHSVIETDDLLLHPRTVGFDDAGTLWVSDSRKHLVLSFDESGTLVSNDTLDGSIPYLAGFEDGSVFVYAPVDHTIRVRTADGVWSETALEGLLPEEKALTYVARTEGGFVSKVIGEEFDGYLGVHAEDGSLVRQIPLEGPVWRRAGLIRSHEGVVYSLSGYRPLIDRLDGTRLDSLDLVGFDSPMLARSFQFVRGDADQPPMLTASAAISGDLIFVLNMRPGWLNIDVFDLDGQLRYILTQPDPSFAKEYYPSDIAVRQRGDGGFDVAVTVTEPSPRVDRFTWRPLN